MASISARRLSKELKEIMNEGCPVGAYCLCPNIPPICGCVLRIPVLVLYTRLRRLDTGQFWGGGFSNACTSDSPSEPDIAHFPAVFPLYLYLQRRVPYTLSLSPISPHIWLMSFGADCVGPHRHHAPQG